MTISFDIKVSDVFFCEMVEFFIFVVHAELSPPITILFNCSCFTSELTKIFVNTLFNDLLMFLYTFLTSEIVVLFVFMTFEIYDLEIS